MTPVFTFRTKLIAGMLLLVAGIIVPTLLITEKQIQASHEKHFQSSFDLQIRSFLKERDNRLAPIKEVMSEAGARNPRLLAAMENAVSAKSEPQDIADLYQNAQDQLAEALKSLPGTQAPFFFFLTADGRILYPPATVKLPFRLDGLRGITDQIEKIGRFVFKEGTQQVGYLAPRNAGEQNICEMAFTPIVDQVTQRRLGVLAIGFPLMGNKPGATIASVSTAATDPGAGSMLSGIWLDGKVYSASIGAELSPALNALIGQQLQGDQTQRHDLVLTGGAIPYRVYCQRLQAGAAFPAAFQVYLYSLAQAELERKQFGRLILLLGGGAFVVAVVLTLLISRGLMVPLQELVKGTSELEAGNYQVKVPVRRLDEIGRLANAFNDMTDRVHASHVAQEERIRERTEELVQRKLAEDALRKSEATLREAQRLAHLGNWQWDVLSNRLEWSDEIYSIFDLQKHQFAGTYEAFLDRVHLEDRAKVTEAVREALAGEQQAYDVQHRIIRPDGEVRFVHERAEVIRNQKAQVIHLKGTVQDITEQKRIEAEFLRAQRLDTIGALAGGMAHDLNNALSPILMGIQLVRRQVHSPEGQQMLSVMEANTHRGAQMVRQVLMFARGKEGEREVLNVGRLIREMETIARQTLPKTIRVSSMVPEDLWPVLGNSTELHQVLLNLAVNARDAMPSGGQITFAADNLELAAEEARSIPAAAPGEYVMLLVADTGTGIAPENLKRIFEPFFTTKGPGKGTGLGLSTLIRIVRNHNGFVNVRSEVGAGTTFEIYLPRATEAQEGGGHGPALSPKRGRGELVLFVDDDRAVREMVTPALTEHGYKVLSAANGAEALVLFAKHENDIRIVLTDYAMPVMDGGATAQAILARRPNLPIIVMSGEADLLKERSLPGVKAYLTKPFRLEQLLSALTNASGTQTVSGL
jgi:PAS domain S-box-containing protein